MLEYGVLPPIKQVSLFLHGKHVITLSFVDCAENMCGAKSKGLLRIIFRGLYETIYETDEGAPDDDDSKYEIIRKTERSIYDVIREIACAELQEC